MSYYVSYSIDVASGGSVDWTYDNEGVLYSYALELRDTGLYGWFIIFQSISNGKSA